MNSKPSMLGSLVLGALFATASLAAEPEDASDIGLVPTKVKNIDKAWKRPDADLASYQRILLRPVHVAFSHKWTPRDYGTFGLRPAEVENIRSSLASLTLESFSRTLTRAGYEVVTTPGENVLDVEVEIFDLFVNAPAPRDTAATRTYVLSAGEMRILVTLRDAVTGTTLFRATDLKRGLETGRLEWANEVWLRAEAEKAVGEWAGQLKDALDGARGN